MNEIKMLRIEVDNLRLIVISLAGWIAQGANSPISVEAARKLMDDLKQQ